MLHEFMERLNQLTDVELQQLQFSGTTLLAVGKKSIWNTTVDWK